jgi:iron complex outermembrane receptor protein
VDLWLGLRRIGAVPAAENGNGIVPACTELDARLGWRVSPQVQLSLVGRGLLNPSHPEIGGLNARREIPRSVAASVRWEY